MRLAFGGVNCYAERLGKPIRMKVVTIEVAEAIEKELKAFLKEWGGGVQPRFTRFIDLGGRQTDLHVYPPGSDDRAWLVARIKSVYSSEQGECMQCHIELPAQERAMNEVVVAPEPWKLPALADRVLKFCKNDLLLKVGEAGPPSQEEDDDAEEAAAAESEAEEEEEEEALDTEGILAGSDDDASGGGAGFDPEEILRAAEAAGDAGGAEPPGPAEREESEADAAASQPEGEEAGDGGASEPASEEGEGGDEGERRDG